MKEKSKNHDRKCETREELKNNQQIIKECPTCGTNFRTYPSVDQKFCKRKCVRRSDEVKAKISKTVKKLHEDGIVYDEEYVRKRNIGTKKSFENGRCAWNKGLYGYKQPKISEWHKKHGHWKKGQTMEKRFGDVRAKEIKNNLSEIRSSSEFKKYKAMGPPYERTCPKCEKIIKHNVVSLMFIMFEKR